MTKLDVLLCSYCMALAQPGLDLGPTWWVGPGHRILVRGQSPLKPNVVFLYLYNLKNLLICPKICFCTNKKFGQTFGGTPPAPWIRQWLQIITDIYSCKSVLGFVSLSCDFVVITRKSANLVSLLLSFYQPFYFSCYLVILLDDDDEIAYFTVRWKTRKLV